MKIYFCFLQCLSQFRMRHSPCLFQSLCRTEFSVPFFLFDWMTGETHQPERRRRDKMGRQRPVYLIDEIKLRLSQAIVPKSHKSQQMAKWQVVRHLKNKMAQQCQLVPCSWAIGSFFLALPGWELLSFVLTVLTEKDEFSGLWNMHS